MVKWTLVAAGVAEIPFWPCGVPRPQQCGPASSRRRPCERRGHREACLLRWVRGLSTDALDLCPEAGDALTSVRVALTPAFHCAQGDPERVGDLLRTRPASLHSGGGLLASVHDQVIAPHRRPTSRRPRLPRAASRAEGADEADEGDEDGEGDDRGRRRRHHPSAEAPARERGEGDGREGLPDRPHLRELRARSDRARTASPVRCELVDDRDPGDYPEDRRETGRPTRRTTRGTGGEGRGRSTTSSSSISGRSSSTSGSTSKRCSRTRPGSRR
jgi:hypothetical protein